VATDHRRSPRAQGDRTFDRRYRPGQQLIVRVQEQDMVAVFRADLDAPIPGRAGPGVCLPDNDRTGRARRRGSPVGRTIIDHDDVPSARFSCARDRAPDASLRVVRGNHNREPAIAGGAAHASGFLTSAT
jgi:hypothetical protein